MGKIRLILITVFAVVIGCIGLLSRTMPPPWYSRVSLAFVGYTNAPSGERLVSFVLSNNSRVRTRCFPVCELVSEQPKVVGRLLFPLGFFTSTQDRPPHSPLPHPANGSGGELRCCFRERACGAKSPIGLASPHGSAVIYR